MRGKKGQEEMVGFVLIVVLVAIIFLVFIGINVRKAGKEDITQSTEVSQFLDSVMMFTTGCATAYEPAYSNVGELILDCRENKQCTNGESACDYLKKTIDELINSDPKFQIGQDRPVKGYKFTSGTLNGNITSGDIVSINKGNCTSVLSRSADYLTPGGVSTTLKLCY